MYLSIYVFSFLISIIKSNKNKVFITLILIIFLSLFAGTRFYVDNDYALYTELFAYNISRLQEYVPFGESELSFYLFPYILSKLFVYDYIKYCFLIFAFLGVGIKLFAIMDYKYYSLAVALYVSNLFFIQEMTTIRAGVACGFFLLSLNDIISGDHKKFFTKISLALFFHHSSVLFIVIWAMHKYSIKMRTYVFLLLGSFMVPILKLNFISLLFLDQLFPKAAKYILIQEYEEEKLNLFNFKILISLLFLTVFIFFYFKGKIKDGKTILFIKIHLISLFVFFLFSSTGLTFSLRLYEMLSIIQILLFPQLINFFPRKLKLLGYIVVIAVSFVFLYYNVFVADLYKDYVSWMF